MRIKNDDDKKRLIGKVCYAYNGESKTSRIFMEYATDGSDKEGDRARARFNGEASDFSSPNYRKYQERVMLEFGAQIYSYDGIDSV